MPRELDPTLTFKNVELTISGFIFVPDPAGSYGISPRDERLWLADVFTTAMTRCGLGDCVTKVMAVLRELVAPEFADAVAHLEEVRQRLERGETEDAKR